MPNVGARPSAERLAGTRRRAWAGVTVAAAVAMVALPGCGAGTGQEEVVASTARPSSAVPGERPTGPAAVFGVTIGWLPDGMVKTGDIFGAGGGEVRDSSGRVVPAFASQTARFATQSDVAAVRAADKVRLDGPQYQVGVSRGQVHRPSPEEQRRTTAKTGVTYEDVTVAGHPATLVHLPGPQPDFAWGVHWFDGIDGENARVEVGVNGTDLDVVLRIARNLTLGPPPPGPADPGSAVAGVQAAARRAFDGSTGLAMLDAVDDTDGRARLSVDKGLSEEPTASATVRVVAVGPVVFLSPRDAGAEVKISYPDEPGLDGPVANDVRFVLTPSGWKVTQLSFCGGMAQVFRSCPSGF